MAPLELGAMQALDLWAHELRYVVRERGGPRAGNPRTGTEILRGVDLSVRAGRVTGLLGPNGSGKTTLLRVTLGALTATGGDVFIGHARGPRGDPASSAVGTPLDQLPRLERARILAAVEQDAQPHDDLTVTEVIALGRLPFQGRFHVPDPSDDAPSRAADRAGVSHLLERAFHSLSGGERQRVQLARALAQTPRILLLDEPTNHLDISAQLDLLDLVQEVTGDGAAVLMALHDLSLAARVCDEVVVLDRGAVVAAGPPLEVLTPSLIQKVWRVEAEWVRGASGTALIFE